MSDTLLRKSAALLMLALTSALVACAENGDCMIADSVEEIRQLSIGDTQHFVNLRTSGFNEKEHFYELYNVKPTFNDCGKSNIKPVAEIHIDLSKGAPTTLRIADLQLGLVYVDAEPEPSELKRIKIEVAQ